MTKAAYRFAAALVVAAISPALAQQASPPIGHGFPQGKALDLAGFYPGMDGRTAQPLLLKHYPIVKDKPAYEQAKPDFVMSKLPSSADGFLRVTKASYYPAFKNYDNITMIFSTPASGNQAVFLRRGMNFIEASRPNREATLRALQEKFGQASRVVSDTVSEYYYSKGRLLTAADGSDSKACGAGGATIGILGLPQTMGVLTEDQPIQQSFTAFDNQMKAAGGTCDIYVRVEWRGGSDLINGRRMPNDTVIEKLDIMIFDHARQVATRTVDFAALKALDEKARQSIPTGTAAPKL